VRDKADKDSSPFGGCQTTTTLLGDDETQTLRPKLSEIACENGMRRRDGLNQNGKLTEVFLMDLSAKKEVKVWNELRLTLPPWGQNRD